MAKAKQAEKRVESAFVQTMLKSAEEQQEAKPQASFGAVSPKQLEEVVSTIQRGKFRQR